MLNLEKINKIIHASFKKDYKTDKIYNVINNFYKLNNVLDKKTITVALIYLDRYNKKRKIDSKDLNDIIFACLLLSNKFSTDLEITNSSRKELDVINTLDWKFFVTHEEFNMYDKFIQALL